MAAEFKKPSGRIGCLKCLSKEVNQEKDRWISEGKKRRCARKRDVKTEVSIPG